jgi:hypothetical protein
MRYASLDHSGPLFLRWVFTSRLATILFICALPAISQNGKTRQALDVEKLMSVSEFRQAGLHKLSAEEIDALNGWLNRFAARPFEAVSASETSSTQPAPAVVETQIEGEFEGWDGETVFKLANGQIWQQSSFAYTYHYAYRPKVLVYKSGTTYKMKVEGVADTVQVKRLK